jgi:hypothetical protein
MHNSPVYERLFSSNSHYSLHLHVHWPGKEQDAAPAKYIYGRYCSVVFEESDTGLSPLLCKELVGSVVAGLICVNRDSKQ